MKPHDDRQWNAVNDENVHQANKASNRVQYVLVDAMTFDLWVPKFRNRYTLNEQHDLIHHTPNHTEASNAVAYFVKRLEGKDSDVKYQDCNIHHCESQSITGLNNK